jgi:protein-disulfide isomerase/uncharacterized membrane protein
VTQDMSRDGSENKSQWILISLVIALIGIGLSIYSTMHHLEVKATGKTDAACNINDKFSCDEVALSQYSEISGVPLGILGLGYFVAGAVLLLVGLRGGKSGKEHLQGYAVMTIIGVLTSVVLGSLSATMGAYCLTCMGVYALTAMQAGTLAFWRKDLPSGFNFKNVLSGGTTAVISVAAIVLIFNFSKSYLTPSAADIAKTAADLPVLAPTAEDIPIAKSAYSGLGEDYRKGNDNAKVVITEFADMQCPACARISETLGAISREYGDRVLIVFRNYPLDSSCNTSVQARIHEHACNAAILARCAGQYGKFWQYHDIAFQRQSSMSASSLRQWGTEVGLTEEQMTTCLASKDMKDKLAEDIALGNKLGVESTPTLFINGRKLLGGRSISDLKIEIDQLLN